MTGGRRAALVLIAAGLVLGSVGCARDDSDERSASTSSEPSVLDAGLDRLAERDPSRLTLAIPSFAGRETAGCPPGVGAELSVVTEAAAGRQAFVRDGVPVAVVDGSEVYVSRQTVAGPGTGGWVAMPPLDDAAMVELVGLVGDPVVLWAITTATLAGEPSWSADLAAALRGSKAITAVGEGSLDGEAVSAYEVDARGWVGAAVAGFDPNASLLAVAGDGPTEPVVVTVWLDAEGDVRRIEGPAVDDDTSPTTGPLVVEVDVGVVEPIAVPEPSEAVAFVDLPVAQVLDASDAAMWCGVPAGPGPTPEEVAASDAAYRTCLLGDDPDMTVGAYLDAGPARLREAANACVFGGDPPFEIIEDGLPAPDPDPGTPTTSTP